MRSRIITISREFGSGGRTIGKIAAQKLNIPCYDAELIERISEQSGFDAEYVKEHGEYAAHGWFAPALQNRSMGPTNQDRLWTMQEKAILDIAEKGPCVIVGRCADFILKDKADCMNVFIHASLEFRAKRIVEEYGERDAPPIQRLKDKDKRRAAYYRFYTDMKWGYADHYDITLDSSVWGVERCADVIVDLYQSKKRK